MEPGGQPSRAPQDRKAEPQPPAPVQTIEGHGQVLLVGGRWPQDERRLTPQDTPEQAPADGPDGPSSIRAASGHSSSSNSAKRSRKRSSDSSPNSADCRAAKSKRSTQKLPNGRLAAEGPRKPECEAAGAPAGNPRSGVAEEAASGGRDPPQPREPRREEPRERLLLVLCRASALRSQLPRLQLLLQQVHARHRRPPAALVGIVVQPPREQEAEAHRLMETLLRSAFARHSPAVEVHTAVFSPCRSEGTLDIQRAANRSPKVDARGSGRLVDRETQTDGDLQGSNQVNVIPVLQALGTVAVALGALGAACHILESL